MNFIKIICNSFEERDYIHEQGCIVNEKNCDIGNVYPDYNFDF